MNLQVFENKTFGKVRVIERNNEPWFVGKDVAEVLGGTAIQARLSLPTSKIVTRSKK